MAKFDVAARTLIHLGAELITSDEIAIYELIKNSFDANSPRVAIKIVAPIPMQGIRLAEEKVRCLKSFNLTSMKEVVDDIESCKRNDLSDSIGHELSVTINRLRVAANSNEALRIIEDLNYIEVSDTGNGMTEKLLGEVFLLIGTDFKENSPESVVTGRPVLGNKGIGRLAMMRLGRRATIRTWTENCSSEHVISFNWRDFEKPNLKISDVEFAIENMARSGSSKSGTVIRLSALRYDWDQDKVRKILVNRFLRRLQNPFDAKNEAIGSCQKVLPQFPIDVSHNGGARLPIKPLSKELWDVADRHLRFDYFPSEASNKQDAILRVLIQNLKSDRREPVTRTLGDVCTKLGVNADDLKRLGALSLTIRWYNRKNLSQSGLGTELKAVREELDIWNGGIAIYRDGFRVGLSGSADDSDWLGLDSAALKRGGFLVNRIQVVGALEITKAGNPYLQDRSNREGLIETPEVIILRELLREYAINELRTIVTAEAEADKKEQMAAIVSDGTEAIEDRMKKAAQNISAIREKAPPELEKHVNELSNNLHFITSQVTKYQKAVVELQERREDILELAGVGTVMHSILHELTRTTTQTRTLLSKISKKSDSETKGLLEKLESEIKAINTRLRQLDPLSPSGRQRKDEFDVTKLVRTILEGYHARFERHDVKAEFTVDGEEPTTPVMVTMVKGFFSLAIENLLTNSVYWVQQGLLPGETERIVRINIDSVGSELLFSDNGPGISPSDRDRVFTAGFSMRPKGNGFGLYIAREVAAHHGATLELDTAEDTDGRLRTFVLQLPKG